MEIWRTELTVSEAYIQDNYVFKLISKSEIIAYYSYHHLPENGACLENLFVLPEYIGKGIGHFLMQDFIKRIKKENISFIQLDADPNAEKFYSKLGFKVIDKKATSIPGRFMPVMKWILE